MLVLAAGLGKKEASGKFYKSSIQNKSYFNKDEIFFITKKEKIDYQYFYWLANTKMNKFIKNRFQRQEIYALSGNFM